MNAAIIYWSRTGNTRRVATTIRQALVENGVDVVIVADVATEDANDLDWFSYDLVCMGFPVHQWSPAKPVDRLLKAKLAEYRLQGRILRGAPTIPGKHALVFCTYCGVHTGVDEALPAVKYAGQYFAHLGFNVSDDWCIVGDSHENEATSTQGRLGDIRGRPNEEDLAAVRRGVSELVHRIRNESGD